MADMDAAMSTPIPGLDKPVRVRKSRPKKAAAPARKKRKAKKAAAPAAKKVRRGQAVQLELHDAIGLAASMHRTDVPIFQQMVELLNAKGKPSRKRLLAGLNKVFG